MENSIFIINVNNKNNEALITYSEINIKDYNEKIYIEDVKKMSSNNKVLNNNYQKFISILYEIENKIKNECEHNFDFKIILKFYIKDISNSIIIIHVNFFFK